MYVFDEKSIYVKLLKRYHDNVLTNHFNIIKTTKLFNPKYYWSDMTKYVKNYIEICDICQKTKTLRHCSYNVMQFLSMSICSWNQIIMNFIIELSFNKHCDNTYDACLVICDRYTKMTLYFSTINTKMTLYFSTIKIIDLIEFAELLFEKIFFRFKISFDVMSNKNLIFISDYWSMICYHLKIKRRLSTTLYSQINEQTKR